MNNQASNSSADGTSTWKASESATGQWNAAANWAPPEVPLNTAIFGTSPTNSINFVQASNTTVNNIEFASGASSYSFNFDFPEPKKPKSEEPALTIKGNGISNKSMNTQSFIVASAGYSYKNPQLQFINSATAGGDNMSYSVGPATPTGYGGGVLGFCDTSTAGSASFTVRTGSGSPPEQSTVGGEVSFSNNSTAATATFTIYGSTSLIDGDTFGNVVFHNSSTAANSTFTNKGGTVPGGDGGNTQFYDNSTAANGLFYNQGGIAYGTLSVLKNGKIVPKEVEKDGKQVPAKQGANGGDVAFDGSATGGNGHFHNFAATVAGANGGVTSFNNNPPNLKPFTTPGANAGYGFYTNYGANGSNLGGGGHTYFTAKHGSPSAANGTFNNHGSAVAARSSAGHTVFSITDGTDGTSDSYGDAKPSGKSGSVYYPTAGNGTFWNHPATSKDGAAGYTEFAVYQPYNADGSRDSSSGTSDSSDSNSDNVPTAGYGTFHNLSGKVSGAAGGVTKFSNTTTAGNATLIAYGGDGGEPGQIEFGDKSLGDKAKVQLHSGGILGLSYHDGGLTIDSLKVYDGGTINTQLGEYTTDLNVSGELYLSSEAVVTFNFYAEEKLDPNKHYTILSAYKLSNHSLDQFKGNSVNGVQPTFKFEDDKLVVSFND